MMGFLIQQHAVHGQGLERSPASGTPDIADVPLLGLYDPIYIFHICYFQTTSCCFIFLISLHGTQLASKDS